MAKNEGFSVVIEYPRKIDLGSVVEFNGKRIEVTKLTSIEPVTEKAFLISGLGNKL
jgi:hypothetical protein